MSNDKLKKLIEVLDSAGYEIAELNTKTRDDSKFDYNEIALLIYPTPSAEKKN